MPAELTVIEERTVGADLGGDAIEMGIMSGLAGVGPHPPAQGRSAAFAQGEVSGQFAFDDSGEQRRHSADDSSSLRICELAFAPMGRNLATWPNLVTLLRLFCLPLFLWLLFGRDNREAVAYLLGVLGTTDWIDGWLARRLDQRSEFGAVFDPAVDRLLLIVGVGAIVLDGSVPPWFGWSVVLREVFVGAMMLGGTALTGCATSGPVAPVSGLGFKPVAKTMADQVTVPEGLVQALCGASLAWGVVSLRAPLLALRAARAASRIGRYRSSWPGELKMTWSDSRHTSTSSSGL